MELHKDLPFGFHLDIGPSYGSRDAYVVTNPYGARGFMVGFNSERGHFLSLTREGDNYGLHGGTHVAVDLNIIN